MRSARLLFVAGGLLLAGGCTSELALDLANKSCDDNDRCVEGYFCNALKVCVPMGDLFPPGGSGGSAGHVPLGGSGGSDGWSGEGGSGSGPVAAGGTGGIGLGGADGGRPGGSGDAGLGGEGGAPDLDAGLSGPPDASDGCAVTTVFRDADGDSFGAGAPFTGCPQPGWVTNGDDCGDGEPLANPAQQGFFGEGFEHVDHPGILSFDYDCSGTEDVDPTNTPATGEPKCDDISDILACMGDGYLPVADRVGEGVNPLCGSRKRRQCIVVSLLGCSGDDINLAPEGAFRCR